MKTAESTTTTKKTTKTFRAPRGGRPSDPRELSPCRSSSSDACIPRAAASVASTPPPRARAPSTSSSLRSKKSSDWPRTWSRWFQRRTASRDAPTRISSTARCASSTPPPTDAAAADEGMKRSMKRSTTRSAAQPKPWRTTEPSPPACERSAGIAWRGSPRRPRVPRASSSISCRRRSAGGRSKVASGRTMTTKAHTRLSRGPR
mmetsp:Transcript_14764/g.60261  ORF Transcript_14764/g.60261 Transcript_14764/m.60261 type:complete len:204 (-) Transcript_14764:1712-2323(-)